MDIKRAIELLETHNKWRRSEDLNPMVNPTDLGKCIDVIVEHFKNNGVLDDVSVSFLYEFVNEFTDTEIPMEAIEETLKRLNEH